LAKIQFKLLKIIVLLLLNRFQQNKMQNSLQQAIKKGFKEIFDVVVDSVEFQATNKDFAGDITVVIFALLRYIKGNPVEIGTKLGNYLKENVQEVKDFNV